MSVYDKRWERYLTLTRIVAQRDGDPNVEDGRVEDGVNLGGWQVAQRGLRRKGKLSPEREQALEAVDGWRWRNRAGPTFEQFAEALRSFVAANGHARVPRSDVTADGVKLGVWLRNMRQGARGVGTHRLTDSQRATLDQIAPGWAEPRVALTTAPRQSASKSTGVPRAQANGGGRTGASKPLSPAPARRFARGAPVDAALLTDLTALSRAFALLRVELIEEGSLEDTTGGGALSTVMLARSATLDHLAMVVCREFGCERVDELYEFRLAREPQRRIGCLAGAALTDGAWLLEIADGAQVLATDVALSTLDIREQDQIEHYFSLSACLHYRITVVAWAPFTLKALRQELARYDGRQLYAGAGQNLRPVPFYVSYKRSRPRAERSVLRAR